jgi:hypothetical protein
MSRPWEADYSCNNALVGQPEFVGLNRLGRDSPNQVWIRELVLTTIGLIALLFGVVSSGCLLTR